MTLREERVLFSTLVVDLLLWIREFHTEAEIALDEGRVQSPRQVRISGLKRLADDAAHRVGSRHHDGCAQDLLLYINGEYITDGGHEVWQDIGARWETLHERAAWGGRFESVDANHVSLASDDGRK